MKTINSENQFERAKALSPGGVHSPVRGFRGVGGVPRFMASGKGAYLTDVDGNRYLDFCQSWGPLLFGHADPEVAEAVTRQLSLGWSYGTAEPYSLELAELITSHIPWVQKIRFVNSGTEAVMSALRVARGATGRSKILKFDGCYHGHVDSMLVRAGSGLAEMANPDSAGVSTAVAGETLVAPLNQERAVEELFTTIGHEIAAVIIEPLPANNGLLIQRDEFLKTVMIQAKKQGALVILDEVISGFRVGFGGMAERLFKLFGMTPDLVTYGKVIGGGFPVGAYGGRQDLMDLVAPAGPVYQAGTLSANPVAMAAGLTMLKKLLRDQPYSKLALQTQKVADRLNTLSKKTGIPFHIQNDASLFWAVQDVPPTASIVREISEIPATQKSTYAKVFHGLLDRGVYLAPSGYEVSFLSTAHTDADIEFFLAQFESVVTSG